jgi:hypothetical protein
MRCCVLVNWEILWLTFTNFAILHVGFVDTGKILWLAAFTKGSFLVAKSEIMVENFCGSHLFTGAIFLIMALVGLFRHWKIFVGRTFLPGDFLHSNPQIMALCALFPTGKKFW